MAAYSPTPNVCINEIPQPGNIIVNNIVVSGGRTNIDEQPRAAYSTIQLINLDNAPVETDLNQCMRVNVKDSSGNDVTLFRGFCTDTNTQVLQAGLEGLAVQTNFTAVSSLARLPKFLSGNSFAKEYDGDRIYHILAGSILTSWEEFDPATTWATVDPALTWNTIDPDNYIEDIERPGDYELTAYSGGAVNVQSIAEAAAKSVNGVLFETPDGMINYESGLGRLRNAEANGFLLIDAAYIQGAGLQIGKSMNDVVNYIEVVYKNDQVVTVEDLDSQTLYGIQGAQKSTQLEKLADAELLADFYLATRATPRTVLQSFTIALHNPDLPDALRDSLLSIRCGTPIELAGLPGWIGNGTFVGFVEGYQWQLTESTAILTCQVSEFELSAIPTNWDQVDPGITWATINPALTWATIKIAS